jgi:hypothetical protein
MDSRLYPIDKNIFRKEVEPRIKDHYRRIGRPAEIRHYKYFMLLYMFLGLALHGEICLNATGSGIAYTCVLEDGV